MMRTATKIRCIGMPVTVVSAPQALYSQQQGGYTAAEYQRRDEHKAHTTHAHEQSYILTLHTDEQHHDYMTTLRERYFPRELNRLDAHIALFRALPGSRLPRIKEDIASLVATQAPFSILAKETFRMKRGAGIRVFDSGHMQSIYARLSAQWKEFLSQQDRGFKPHYTVQNKVEDEAVVQRTMEELGDKFTDSPGRVLGLRLWRYAKGNWKHDQDFAFTEEEQ